MRIENTNTDKVVLEEVGRRLAARRVEMGITQAQLAREAGVGKRTLERVESGETTQTSTLIRILRALGLLEELNTAIPESGPRPMDLLKLKHPRRRASTKTPEESDGEPWAWEDES